MGAASFSSKGVIIDVSGMWVNRVEKICTTLSTIIWTLAVAGFWNHTNETLTKSSVRTVSFQNLNPNYLLLQLQFWDTIYSLRSIQTFEIGWLPSFCTSSVSLSNSSTRECRFPRGLCLLLANLAGLRGAVERRERTVLFQNENITTVKLTENKAATSSCSFAFTMLSLHLFLATNIQSRKSSTTSQIRTKILTGRVQSKVTLIRESREIYGIHHDKAQLD